jgi:integrase
MRKFMKKIMSYLTTALKPKKPSLFKIIKVANIVQNLNYYGNGLIPANRLRGMLGMRISPRYPREQENGKSFLLFIEHYITESEKLKSRATVRQYRNTLRLLLDFSIKVQNIDFHDIDLSFYANFKGYMDEAGYSESYFSNQIKNIRLFMNEATERGYNGYLQYKNRKFIAPQVTADKIYLTMKEIRSIHSVKLPASENLETIRDMFVVACHTGLRFSDLVRLQPSNFIVEEQMMCLRTKKTDTLVYIPLSPAVMKICAKYNFQMRHFTNSTFNACIKEVGRLAGLVDVVAAPVSPGNPKTLGLMPKYQLISSHTARRSFATNAFLAGVPSISIMQITGHVTEKSFLKYIRVSGKENARKLLDHPYFSKK